MYLLINEWLMTLLFLIKNYQTTYNKKLLFQKIFCKTYHIIDKEIKVNRRISFYAFFFSFLSLYFYVTKSLYKRTCFISKIKLSIFHNFNIKFLYIYITYKCRNDTYILLLLNFHL